MIFAENQNPSPYVVKVEERKGTGHPRKDGGANHPSGSMWVM
jgi:hypothetical protein